MPPSADLLDRARHLHRSGDLSQAERLCRQLLGSDPGHAEAWHLLGSLLEQQNKPGEAAAAFQQLLRLQPDSAEAHFRLGQALATQGQREPALVHYRQAVRLRPDHADALNALGIALAEQRHLDEAIAQIVVEMGLVGTVFGWG